MKLTKSVLARPYLLSVTAALVSSVAFGLQILLAWRLNVTDPFLLTAAAVAVVLTWPTAAYFHDVRQLARKAERAALTGPTLLLPIVPAPRAQTVYVSCRDPLEADLEERRQQIAADLLTEHTMDIKRL